MRYSAPNRILLAILAVLAAAFALPPAARADAEVFEAALDPAGAAIEVNVDAQGVLWISDYDRGQVRGFYPEQGYFEVYPVGGHPSDARHDGAHLWWVDAESNIVGRVSTVDGAVTRWAVPGAAGFYGTVLDKAGRLWFAAFEASHLYRLDTSAATAELCTYTLPASGEATYIVRQDDYLWLGDYVNGRLLRLHVSDNSLASWTLPPGSVVFGMAVDGKGGLWYASMGSPALARLAPGSDPGAGDPLAVYPVSGAGSPRMAALLDGEVWYTMQGPAGIGRIDPQAAPHTSATLQRTESVLPGACAPLAADAGGELTITNVDASWNAVGYPVTVNRPGWQVYGMPEGAVPAGIAAGGGDIWFIDTNRRVLGRLTPPPLPVAKRVYLPLVIR